VTGLPAPTVAALAGAASAGNWTDADWQALLRVSVKAAGNAGSTPAVTGTYTIAGDAVRFTPMFPFDEGRQYDVVLDPARLPAIQPDTPWRGQVISSTVGRPAVARTPSTVVTHLYPSGDRSSQISCASVPSAPWTGAADTTTSRLDGGGQEVVDLFCCSTPT
jgi:hypothetical protein